VTSPKKKARTYYRATSGMLDDPEDPYGHNHTRLPKPSNGYKYRKPEVDDGFEDLHHRNKYRRGAMYPLTVHM